MVKGVSRRVVVVEPPDQKVFEQAIFIVRDGETGVSARELVEEARRAALDYAGPERSRFERFRRRFGTLAGVLLGASAIGIAWLVWLFM